MSVCVTRFNSFTTLAERETESARVRKTEWPCKTSERTSVRVIERTGFAYERVSE